MRRLILFLLLPLAMALGGCQNAARIDTPRERLAAAESAFAVATQTCNNLYRAGFIKKESATDVAVDKAIRGTHAQLILWRANPDSPSYMAATLSALQSLVDLANALAAQQRQQTGFLVITTGRAHA